ncbi:hypothetical protein KSP40_PGU006252 [Platanthera guangdongensis]|uniref:Uncharacterized protein n=1 Tax=Platanthera guangdongensis TaxID=2320717 RepID=A0ABR2M6U1_9ASPA
MYAFLRTDSHALEKHIQWRGRMKIGVLTIEPWRSFLKLLEIEKNCLTITSPSAFWRSTTSKFETFSQYLLHRISENSDPKILVVQHSRKLKQLI